MTTATATAPMTPLDPALTVRRRNRQTGRPEIWEAVSADGVWAYIRTEESSTPWHIEHRPTGRVHLFHASLPKARRATADGWVLADLDHRTAA